MVGLQTESRSDAHLHRLVAVVAAQHSVGEIQTIMAEPTL
jgi:hypothetical protein